MHIVRGPRKADHFTILANTTLRNAELSFGARGVLAMLLSYPDGYHLTADNIALRSDRDGRRQVLAYLRELRNAGHLYLHKWQDEHGRWQSLNVLYEEPRTPSEALAEIRELSTGTGVRLPAAGQPNSGPRTAIGSTKEKEQGGGGPAPRPPDPVDKSTAPPPCRRHPNGWRHDDPCRACAALRQHAENATAPLPMPPHCGHCDVTDRTITTTDAYGRITAARCPRCHPRALTTAQP